MTDRAKELVDEFSKTMDTRTYDQKMSVVIDHVDERIDKLTDIVGELNGIVGRQQENIMFHKERILELESRLKMLEMQQGTL